MDKLAYFELIFEPSLIAEINDFGELKHFKEGDVILDYGQFIQMMPMVIKGSVKVLRKDEHGKEILLYFLLSNESCSMAYSGCAEAQKSEVSLIAEEDVELLAIPYCKLDEWLGKYPGWKNYIISSFKDRFLELVKSIEIIAFHKLDERLVAYLKEKQRVSGSMIIKGSHFMIADELATSRVVISRLLKHLENEGKILLCRNRIELLNGF